MPSEMSADHLLERIAETRRLQKDFPRGASEIHIPGNLILRATDLLDAGEIAADLWRDGLCSCYMGPAKRFEMVYSLYTIGGEIKPGTLVVLRKVGFPVHGIDVF